MEQENEKEPTTTDEGGEGTLFACHICLECASDPVVTVCGHMFCWPCIYRVCLFLIVFNFQLLRANLLVAADAWG